MSVPDWEDPRRVMRRHGMAPKRRFSQNFLVSRSAVERIAAALRLADGERVVELGPGLGTLTAELLRAGARVHAIEADDDMIAVLAAELGACERLTVTRGDAAKLDLSALAAGERLKVCGNLPYAITGAILKNLSRHRAALRSAVVMVQREVAARLIAAPGSKTYGALSVFTQASFAAERVLRVPAGAFHPAPKVDSAVIRLDVLDAPRAVEREAFRAVVKAAFGQRRKTLRNSLRALGELSEASLAASGVDPGRRAETLSVEELDAIAAAYEALCSRQR